MRGSKRNHNEAGYTAKDIYYAYKLVKVVKMANSAVDFRCSSDCHSDWTKGKFGGSIVQTEQAVSLDKRGSLTISKAKKLHSKITCQRTANKFDLCQEKSEVACWDRFDKI